MNDENVETIATSTTDNQPVENPQLELARQQRLAEEAAERRAQFEFQNQKLAAETLAMKYQQNLDCELQKLRVRFYDTKAALKLLDESVKIGPGLNGEVRVEVNGQPVSLQEVLEDFALKNTWLVEDLGELRFDDTKITKADLRTNEEKSAFISRRGLETWERLPLNHEELIDVSRMSGPQYLRLPLNRRRQLIELLGPDGIAEILKRKG